MITGLLRDSLKDNKTRVIGIDPGQTSGVCCFEGSNLLDVQQLQTGLMPLAAVNVREYLQKHSLEVVPPPVVVMERYAIYEWKVDSHAWSTMHTSRLIGAIELICYDLGLQLAMQSAQQAKGFNTDQRLKEWGLYQVGLPHARDSIRHACYYLLFNVAKVHQPDGGKKS